MDLTDEQWQVLALLISSTRTDSRGRSRRHLRDVINGILWKLRTGAQWQDLTARYPPKSTCHRWHQKWSKDGVFDDILLALAEDQRDRSRFDLSEAFIDGTFSPAQKGGLGWKTRKGGKDLKSLQLRTAMVFLSPSTWTALTRMK